MKLIDPTIPIRRDKFQALFAGAENFEDKDIPKLPYVPVEIKKASCTLNGAIDLNEDNNFTISSLEKWKNKSPCLLKGKIDILLNGDFTFLKVKEKLKNIHYPIVHLATHAIFDTDPEKTYLKTYDRQRDITMNGLEEIIYPTKFRIQPIELLTLSACETAKGDKRAAFGLAGIAIKAGARSTLATLWPVKDPSTAQLMVEFYRQLKKEPTLTKAELLQKAQRQLLEKDEEVKGKKYNHPHYWAPFLLIGNWL